MPSTPSLHLHTKSGPHVLNVPSPSGSRAAINYEGHTKPLSSRWRTDDGRQLYSVAMKLPRAIGYVRVSTEEQARSALGLEAQERAIRLAAEQRGWELVGVITDAGISGSKKDRPGLQSALQRMRRKEAQFLVVAKLDRLSRSIRDGADVIDQASRQGWALVDLGSGVDMSTPAGEMVAGVLLSAAQYERRLIGVRTKEGLASAKSRGMALGKPTTYPDELLVRIHDMHRDGLSLRQIAEALSAARVTTAKGGSWYASSVRSVLNSERMAAIVAA